MEFTSMLHTPLPAFPKVLEVYKRGNFKGNKIVRECIHMVYVFLCMYICMHIYYIAVCVRMCVYM